MYKSGIQGNATITRWCEKFGNFDHYSLRLSFTMKTPEQKIYELEQRLHSMERENKFLKTQLM